MMTADAQTLKLARSLGIAVEQAVALVAAGCDTPRKAEALADDALVEIVGQIPPRIARKLAPKKAQVRLDADH